MGKKAVDFLPALKFVPDWFIISKMIKKIFTTFYADDIFNEDFGDSYFLVMKWVFLVYIFMILTLMILIMMRMILKLLFMSDFWLDILNLKDLI